MLSDYNHLDALAKALAETKSAFWGGLETVPVGPELPSTPGTTPADVRNAEESFDKRLAKLKDVIPITDGRVVPADDDLAIGAAKRMKPAVLFLDICKFSQIPSYDEADQDNVLRVLNLFMAEMLYVIRAHQGEFEKNTAMV